MYIDEITIEGFKSFSKRVVVQKLDPSFNAITGQNGTGKSNLLDAICFVLGMKNLAQMRVNSIQELIFARGTSGVTKASVSISFINNNPETGPLAYKDDKVIVVTRQVQLGGLDKYLVNGRTEVQKKVRDLFCSVQLNVNNPHFLIMQGSISRVLGMSPKETLGLLEEAAGTSLYQSKRTEAINTLQKKENQLHEIDELLQEEMQPRVQRLQEERDQYLKCQEADRQMKNLQHFVQAYDYFSLAQSIDSFVEGGAQLDEQLQDILSRKTEMDGEIAECKQQQKHIMDAKEAQHGPEIRQIKQNIAQILKQIAEQESDLSNQKDVLDQDSQLQKELQERYKGMNAEVLQGKYQEAKQQADSSQLSYNESMGLLEQLKEELKGLESGQNQKMNCTMKERISSNQTQQMTVQHQIRQMTNQIKQDQEKQDQQPQIDRQQLQQVQTAVEGHQKVVSQLQQQVQQIGFDEEQYSQLRHQSGQLAIEVRRTRTYRDDMRHSMGELNNGVQHGEYCGTVAELIQVTKEDCIVAVNVAAGPNLRNAIMQRMQTAKELIESKKLPKQVRFTSLDDPEVRKRGKKVSEDKQKAAHALVGNNACLAVDLIQYDQRYDHVMNFIFGDTFICKDKETALRLSDARGAIACKCVTLEGDFYQPGGLLTGGSRKLQNILLKKMTMFRAADEEFRNVQAQHDQMCRHIGQLEQKQQQHIRLVQQLDQAQLEMSKTVKQAGQMEEEIKKIEADQQNLQNCRKQLEDKQQQLEDLLNQQQELQYQNTNFEAERGNIMKATKKKIEQQEKVVEQQTEISKHAQMMLTEVTTEITVADSQRPELEQQLQEVSQRVSELEAEIVRLQRIVDDLRYQHGQMLTVLEDKKKELRGQDDQIQVIGEKIDLIQNQKMDLEGRRMNVEREINQNHNHRKHAEEQSKKMERDFPFIAAEKHKFGTQGSKYDWQERDPEEARAQLKECEQTIQNGQNVNRNVLLDQQEIAKSFEELTNKRRNLESDKRQIQKVIGELDQRQHEVLQRVWGKVNKDMGRIFQSLLPGTQASLETLPGKNFLEGLVIKVAFGEIQKTLQEMSGGQRSLLALSFLLALLLYKPAPIYILDEVDAALDLNHTQNIGKMIKQYFPHSQFLIVSHKDGMFNNANVLYRTSFVENSTQIQRKANNDARRRSVLTEIQV